MSYTPAKCDNKLTMLDKGEQILHLWHKVSFNVHTYTGQNKKFPVLANSHSEIDIHQSYLFNEVGIPGTLPPS